MTSHSADRSSSRTAAASPPTPARKSLAADTDAVDFTAHAQNVSGAFVYGYDSAGNPTLTDAGCYDSAEGRLPD